MSGPAQTKRSRAEAEGVSIDDATEQDDPEAGAGAGAQLPELRHLRRVEQRRRRQTMLNIELLTNPIELPAGTTRPADLVTGDERLEEISQLSLDGEYLLAADRCRQLLEGGHYDARLIGYFLFGVYLERGAQALPSILAAVRMCLTKSFEALTPQAKREVFLDSALQWLFSSLLKQIERAEQQQDATWQALVEVKNLESVKAMRAELTQLAELAAKLVKRPRAVQPIAHLEQTLKQAYTAIETSAESLRLSALSQISAGPRPAEDKDRSGAAKDSGFDTSDLGAQKARGPARGEEDEDDGEGADGDADADSDAEADGDGEGGPEDSDLEDGAPEEDESEPEPEDEPEAEREEEDEGRARKKARDKGRDKAPDKGRDKNRPAPEVRLPKLPRAEEPRARRAPSGGRGSLPSIRLRDDHGSSITIEGSPALLELVRRIQAFERLCQRGELLKAAVVADSVLGTLDNFDPRAFFPSLFLPFFALLSDHAQDLESAMNERDSLVFKSLQQLLQVNIDALLK